MSLKVVSEGIPTHVYESKTLTKAFEDITGIKVQHQIIGEGDVVMAVQTQMQTNVSIYDAYVNDSDLIGTHARMQQAVNLTEWMAGEGKDVTLPTLDLKDFIGLQFTTGPDGNLYQLPDQQFANLYWFRKDWFDRPEIKKQFKAKYGYELGVPVNWSAYEDIAKFFSEDVKKIDGVNIYGHMDYGKRAPDLGWRMTDAWLSMAGAGSKGLPNGVPVDEWGIRMEKGSCNPVGANVSRCSRSVRLCTYHNGARQESVCCPPCASSSRGKGRAVQGASPSAAATAAAQGRRGRPHPPRPPSELQPTDRRH